MAITNVSTPRDTSPDNQAVDSKAIYQIIIAMLDVIDQHLDSDSQPPPEPTDDAR